MSTVISIVLFVWPKESPASIASNYLVRVLDAREARLSAEAVSMRALQRAEEEERVVEEREEREGEEVADAQMEEVLVVVS